MTREPHNHNVRTLQLTLEPKPSRQAPTGRNDSITFFQFHDGNLQLQSAKPKRAEISLLNYIVITLWDYNIKNGNWNGKG